MLTLLLTTTTNKGVDADASSVPLDAPPPILGPFLDKVTSQQPIGTNNQDAHKLICAEFPVVSNRHFSRCGHPRYWTSALEWKYSCNSLHQTQKRVCILTPLIECFSLPGDVVLDPFCGSGSTLVAAQQLGRQFVRIELSKRYFNLVEQRLR